MQESFERRIGCTQCAVKKTISSGRHHHHHRNQRQNVSKIDPRPSSCYDKFAFAKKLHAENLQHQPLPDRVDDRLFKNLCQRRKNEERDVVLGCKKPLTRMDLAICWETPIDPTYEPKLAKHIDGTEGGNAPAIFTLVEHNNNAKSKFQANNELLNKKETSLTSSTSSGSLLSNSLSESHDKTHCCCRCCCDCLCNNLDKMNVSNFERKVYDPRLTRSAMDLKNRRNGLSSNLVPRPRTPFARRSFCIDTLMPPFSVVTGCRDADYPEHWRLMSIYQQSFKNPQKRPKRY